LLKAFATPIFTILWGISIDKNEAKPCKLFLSKLLCFIVILIILGINIIFNLVTIGSDTIHPEYIMDILGMENAIVTMFLLFLSFYKINYIGFYLVL